MSSIIPSKDLGLSVLPKEASKAMQDGFWSGRRLLLPAIDRESLGVNRATDDCFAGCGLAEWQVPILVVFFV